MRRRIVLSVLIFCTAVIVAMMLTNAAVLNRDATNQMRQAIESDCRTLAWMVEQRGGVEEGYIESLKPYEAGVHFDPWSVPDEQGGAAIRDAVQYRKTSSIIYHDAQKARRLIVAMPLAEGGAVSISEELSLRSALRFDGFVVTVIILIVVVSVIFAVYLSSSITRPISRMSAASTQFMKGNYDSRVEVTTQDEMGRLGVTFNEMAERLESTIGELNAKSAEIETILNAMSSGLLVVDANMHVIRINPAARRVFDVHGDAYGKYVLDVTRNVKLENHLINAMERAGELYTAELSVRVEGRNRQLRLYITDLQQDDQSIGAMALIEDVTELRRLEQVRVDFVANVTHELKTPLTSIRGFIETLQQGAIDDPETARRFLSIISMESERLTRLIDDILHISTLEAGRKKTKLERLAFAPYVHQITELLTPNAQERNIELVCSDHSRNASIMGSEDKIKQLLINLIDNAIKYNHENGHVWMDVSLEGSDVVLTVRDDGIGIAEEHMSRLFERFYRVDKGRSRSMGGTGLGLSIVKHIVLEMNGTIDVQSITGEGTTFTVRLPHAPKEEKTDAGH